MAKKKSKWFDKIEEESLAQPALEEEQDKKLDEPEKEDVLPPLGLKEEVSPAPLKEDKKEEQKKVKALDKGVRSQTTTKFNHMLREKPEAARKYLRQIPKNG